MTAMTALKRTEPGRRQSTHVGKVWQNACAGVKQTAGVRSKPMGRAASLRNVAPCRHSTLAIGVVLWHKSVSRFAPVAPPPGSTPNGRFCMTDIVVISDDRRRRTCPHCAHAIVEGAKVCGACGREVPATAAPGKPDETLAQAMLVVPLVAFVVIWLWMSLTTLYPGPTFGQGPARYPLRPPIPALVVVATIVMTAALAARDAKRLNMGEPSDPKKGFGPTFWFIAIVLLWPVCYPAYLRRRKAYCARSRLFAGIVVALIFVWISAGVIRATMEKSGKTEGWYDHRIASHHQHEKISAAALGAPAWGGSGV
jgi:hypothetical protein